MKLVKIRCFKTLSAICRATIGKVAGDGIRSKPFAKAGTKFHKMKSRGKYYPRVKGVSMNAVDHPFGGSATPGKHKTVRKDAPPGQKVGSIGASSMGRGRKKKKKGL